MANTGNTKWRLWLGLVFSNLTCILFGMDFAFSIYALPLKQTFNFTQTEVELVSAAGLMGLGASLVEPFITNRFGYTVGYLVIWVTSSGFTFIMSVVVVFKEFTKHWPSLVCLIQFLINAGQNAGSTRLMTTSCERLSALHTGKVVGLGLAGAGAGKIFYGGLFQLWSSDDLRGFFFSAAVIQAVLFGLCFVTHRPEDEAADSQSGMDLELSESTPLKASIVKSCTSETSPQPNEDQDRTCFNAQMSPLLAEDVYASRFLHDASKIMSQREKITKSSKVDTPTCHNESTSFHQEIVALPERLASCQDDVPPYHDKSVCHDHEIMPLPDESTSYLDGSISHAIVLPPDESTSYLDESISHEIVSPPDDGASYQADIPPYHDESISHGFLSPPDESTSYHNESISDVIVPATDESISYHDESISHGIVPPPDESTSYHDECISHEIVPSPDESASYHDDTLSDQNYNNARDDEITSHPDKNGSPLDEISSHQGKVPTHHDRISEDSHSENSDNLKSDTMFRSFHFHLMFWPSAVIYSILLTYMNNMTSIAHSLGHEQPIYVVYTFSVAIIIGRLFFGVLFDKFQSNVCGFVLLFTGSLCTVAGITLTLVVQDDAILYSVAFLFGIGVAVGITIPSSVLALRFGRRNLAYIIGCLYCFTAVFSLLFQYMIGVLYDRTLAIDNFCYGSACFFLSSVVLLTVVTLATSVHVINCVIHCLRGRQSK